MPEEFKLGDDFSSLVFVKVLPRPTGDKVVDKVKGHIPTGYVFVIEEYKRDPFWKFPGGHGKRDETPCAAASRELRGEAGVGAPEENFRQIDCVRRLRPVPHWLFLFDVSICEDELMWMGSSHPENEGERPQFFSVEQFYELVRNGRFFPPHYAFLTKNDLVLPLGRDDPQAIVSEN